MMTKETPGEGTRSTTRCRLRRMRAPGLQRAIGCAGSRHPAYSVTDLTRAVPMFKLFALLIFTAALRAAAVDDYVPGPDSKPQPDAPKGEVTRYTFEQSKFFLGTTREYWVYVPKQYDATKPTPVMVF